MKTLEEVKAHMSVNGYNQLAIHKIEGFLLGNGLLGGDFEMECMIGNGTFDDFRKWFNGESKKEFDWSEFGFGDCIHVEGGKDGLNVIVLSDGIYGNELVGMDNDGIFLYELTDESRPCNEEEIELIQKSLAKKGIAFCFDNLAFTPKDVCKDCQRAKSESEAIDKIEVRAKVAVENIVASALAGEMADDEKELALGTLEALILLGNEYED